MEMLEQRGVRAVLEPLSQKHSVEMEDASVTGALCVTNEKLRHEGMARGTLSVTVSVQTPAGWQTAVQSVDTSSSTSSSRPARSLHSSMAS